MFLGAGAERNLYRKIFGYLDKATLCLARTHVCKDWYALIAKTEPWTATEIIHNLCKASYYTAFNEISRHWYVLPNSKGRWRNLYVNSIEKDYACIVHWLSKRVYGRNEPGEISYYHLFDIVDVVQRLALHDPKDKSQLWDWVIGNLIRETKMRIDAFWILLFLGHVDAFRFFINKGLWDVKHMGFVDSPWYHRKACYLYRNSDKEKLKEKLVYLHAQGATDEFWSDFVYTVDTYREADGLKNLIVLIHSIIQKVKPEYCQRLKDRGDVNLHNDLRPWCQCIGPVLRLRKKQKI